MKHKHCELIKAWADGAEIEFRFKDISTGEWTDWKITPSSICCWRSDNDFEYRIKPEPKFDVVRYYKSSSYQALGDAYYLENDYYDLDAGTKKAYRLKTVWDSETQELKSAEVLK